MVLHAAGSVSSMEPHGCLDPEELSSRSDKFIPVGWAFFSAGWVGASHGQGLRKMMIPIPSRVSCAGEPPWVMEEVFVENSRGLL